MNQSSAVRQGIEKLKAKFAERLPGRLDTVSDLWFELFGHGWSDQTARQLHSDVHDLCGTGKTFGFSQLSKLARTVESQLSRIFDSGLVPDRTELEALELAVTAMLVNGPVEDQPTPRQVAIQAVDFGDELPEFGRVEPLSNLPIYIVEDDQALADHLVLELALRGYDGRALYALDDLERELSDSHQPPGALIMDIIFPDAMTGGIDIINQFRRDEILKAPVIFISASDSFKTRLEVVRAGGDAFFVKPLDVNILIEKLESLVGETQPEPLRILILDDDADFGQLICVVLEDAGLQARAISEPATVVEIALEYRPDLIMLDMNMPVANGMEVAMILRQHESCGDIPLLFLSGESDAEVRAQALNIGVDDFLVKPIDHRYLISAVANRAQRARALGTKIMRDSLTHLLVHDEIKTQLANHLSNSRRHGRPLTYAILDIDRFKLVNDTHGHLTGDHVIKSIASLLRRSFRRSDVIGRYGGEEFVVIMPDADSSSAAEVLNRVREEFSTLSHRSEVDGSSFQATFSVGICSYPAFEDAEEIQVRADQALYDAKDGGRNRVCVAPSD